MTHPQLHWTLDPAFLAVLAAGTVLYCRRFVHARREAGGRGAGPRQAALFAAFVLVMLVALVSPLDGLGEDYLFSMHMTQHILIVDIGPLLLLLSLSRVILRPLTRRLVAVERALGPVAHPVTGILLWLALVYLWHVPPLYNAAVEHDAVHALEHVSFFTAGLAVWWPLVQPVPMRHRLTGLWTFAYIFGAKVGLGLLGVYLTWSDHVAYGYYEHVPRIWGLTALEDQNLGGAIMMVEQSIVLVLAFAVLFVRMLLQSEQEELRRERLEDAATTA
ncbi:MAG: cytochrome c oxidase assembly protein [Thermoleophilaceae bacterium]|nr:cytochrome c oxidase assembly protein [Thermoleophilaceae bacterium]